MVHRCRLLVFVPLDILVPFVIFAAVVLIIPLGIFILLLVVEIEIAITPGDVILPDPPGPLVVSLLRARPHLLEQIYHIAQRDLAVGIPPNLPVAELTIQLFLLADVLRHQHANADSDTLLHERDSDFLPRAVSIAGSLLVVVVGEPKLEGTVVQVCSLVSFAWSEVRNSKAKPCSYLSRAALAPSPSSSPGPCSGRMEGCHDLQQLLSGQVSKQHGKFLMKGKKLSMFVGYKRA